MQLRFATIVLGLPVLGLGLGRDAVPVAGVAAGQDARAPKQPTCMTTTCHTEYAGRAHAHGPVVIGKCTLCHEADEDTTLYESGENHYFELAGRDGRLCIQCHESQTTDEHVHYPIRRHRCLACHDPHGSDHPAMMRHPIIEQNCFECHEKLSKDEKYVHGPVALGQCTTCHDPHSSPNPYQLVAAGPELCFQCHAEIAGQLAEKTHVHRPVVEDCNQCHDPHDGPEPVRLRKQVPDLCVSCHEDIGARVNGAANKHGALANDRSCLYCHDPHTSDFGRQLRDIPINLCLSCHDEPLLGDRGLIKDMKGYLERNHDRHGPVREGDCGACHDPHGSDHTRILRKEYPPEFYAPFEDQRYALCFTCHERSLVHDPETDTLTGFRNGTKNLHYVHVNRERKGRTCRACHDVHATKNPKHITDSVPFGPSWSYEIRYEKSETGGRCGPACHQSRGYDRVKAVDNR